MPLNDLYGSNENRSGNESIELRNIPNTLKYPSMTYMVQVKTEVEMKKGIEVRV